jgi:UDP:flavonoid glycosyltransferase YjiC (YdhE family)
MRILLVWEMGAGLGHLARLGPLARVLIRAGHVVKVVARDVEGAGRVFPHGVEQSAPSVSAPAWERIREPASLAEVLFNNGAFSGPALADLVSRWRQIFADTRPELVVLDYAPFALLALQGWPARIVLLGTGFATPPDVSPLPDLRPWQGHYPDRLLMNEMLVRDLCNECLAAQHQQALDRLAELFTRVDANLLTTFPELDHYPGRVLGSQSAYVGTWSEVGGVPPTWPAGDGPRVFAYLKPFPALLPLLRHLGARGVRALVHLPESAGNVPEDLPGIRIAREPVAVAAAARCADLAILNAGHGTTAEMLLAGTPILEIPILVEQGMVADRVEAVGAGLRAPLDDPQAVIHALERMLLEQTWRQAARAFALKHRDHDPARALDAVARQIAAVGGGQGRSRDRD